MSLFVRMLTLSKLSLLALLLAACSPVVNDMALAGGGIGGTGMVCGASMNGGGIGGTGIACDDLTGGGIGGTGISNWQGGIGGTGIVGTITGFGSIIVNGIHIEYEQSQTVETVFGDKPSSELSIGQVVAVQAEIIDGAIRAQRIIEQTALYGVVESVDIDKGEMVIDGERVLMLDNANNPEFDLSQIQVGSKLAISGVRDATALYASFANRVDDQFLDLPNLKSGRVTHVDDVNIVIDNRITIPLLEYPSTKQQWSVGDFVSVEGPRNNSINQGDGKQLKTLRKVYGNMLDGKVNRIAIEKLEYTNGQKQTLTNDQAQRKVLFYSKDKNEKLQLQGSLVSPAKAWQRADIPAARFKANKERAVTEPEANSAPAKPEQQSLPSLTNKRPVQKKSKPLPARQPAPRRKE
jgi:hypothetical protein